MGALTFPNDVAANVGTPPAGKTALFFDTNANTSGLLTLKYRDANGVVWVVGNRNTGTTTFDNEQTSPSPVPAAEFLWNGLQGMAIYPSLAAGDFNGIVANNDTGIIFGSITGTKSLVLAPWSSSNIGIRIDANAGLTTVYGNASFNSNVNVTQTLNVSGIATFTANIVANTLTVSSAANVGNLTAQSLQINPSGNNSSILNMNKPSSGLLNYISGWTNGNRRWVVNFGDASVESGNNAGSDFTIDNYSDSGTYISSPLTITRANGHVSIGYGLNVTGNNTITGNLSVSGNSSVSQSLTVSGDITVTGNLSVSGTSSMSGVASSLTIGEAAGPYIYESDATNHVLSLRVGLSSAYKYFSWDQNGYFNVSNGGLNVNNGNTNFSGGAVTVNSQELILNGVGSSGQLRMLQGGSIGVFWRWDSTNFYLMKTAANNQLGSWDSTRPFVWNVAGGGISSDQAWSIDGSLTVNNAVSFTSYGLGNTLELTDTGSNGVGLRLLGNGSTTPSKVIRVVNGQLQFVNDAYSAVVSSMDDSGNWSMQNIRGAIAYIGNYNYNGVVTNMLNGSAASCSVGWNYTAGSGEIDFCNTWTGGGGFNWYKYANSTAVSVLLTLSGAGDLSVNSGNRMIAGAFQSSSTGLNPQATPGGGAFRAQGNYGGGISFIDGGYSLAMFSVSGNMTFGFGNSTSLSISSASIHSDGAIYGARFSAGYDSGVAYSFNTSDWFRSAGNVGWFNVSYGGGIYMIDSTYVRTYNGKQMAAADFVISSDLILKDVDGPLIYDPSMRMEPIWFHWKETGKADFGFGAQTLEKNHPLAVSEYPDPKDLSRNIKNVSYHKLTAVLSAQANYLEDELNALKAEVQQIKCRIGNRLK